MPPLGEEDNTMRNVESGTEREGVSRASRHNCSVKKVACVVVALAAVCRITITARLKGDPTGDKPVLRGGAPADSAAFYSDLRWRHIGPFRGGRTVGAAGV